MRRVPRPVAGWVLAASLALGPVLAPSGAAYADPAGDLVAMVNSARAAAGLAGYAVAGDLTAVAAAHAAAMAASHTLAHNPTLTSQVCCWRAIAENIAYASSAAQANALLLGDPPHRANILSAVYTQVGIGAATGSDGMLYVDEVFRLPTGAVPPARPPHTAPPRPTSRVTSPASPSRPGQPVVQPAERASSRARAVAALADAVLATRLRALLRATLLPTADPLRRGLRWWRAMTGLLPAR